MPKKPKTVKKKKPQTKKEDGDDAAEDLPSKKKIKKVDLSSEDSESG